MKEDEKVCPRCAETIKKAALVCRYCGHEFEAAAATPEPPNLVGTDVSVSDGTAPNRPDRLLRNTVLSGVGVLLFIVLIVQCSNTTTTSADNYAIDADNLVIDTSASEADLNAPVANADNTLDASAEAAPVMDSSGSSSSVPYFDSAEHCRQVSEVGGTGSYTIEETCRNMEAAARDEIAGLSIPDRVAAHCKQVAEVGGPGSYTIYKTCIEMELGAASRL